MKPILLVIAGIAVLILTIYLNNRKAGHKNLQPVSEKSRARGVIMKDSYSFLSNEVRMYNLVY